MASAKQIKSWVREIVGETRHVQVQLRAKRVIITVDGATFEIADRAIGFGHVAQALLNLGPSCAEEGAKSEH